MTLDPRHARCRLGKHKWRLWVRTDGTRSGVEWCFRCHATRGKP